MHSSQLSRSIRSLALAAGASLFALSLAGSAQAGNCTRSNGYWGTHSKYDPNPDPTWNAIGEGKLFFLSGRSYYQMLTDGTQQNPYNELAVNYIAAALNAYAGADMPSDVAAAFIDATSLFQVYTPSYDFVTDPDGVRGEFEDLTQIHKLYNRGKLGPGACKGSRSR